VTETLPSPPWAHAPTARPPSVPLPLAGDCAGRAYTGERVNDGWSSVFCTSSGEEAQALGAAVFYPHRLGGL